MSKPNETRRGPKKDQSKIKIKSKFSLFRAPHLSKTHLTQLKFLRSSGDVLPQKHLCTVTSNGAFITAAATVNITGQLRVNSLLLTASDWTGGMVAQSSYLAGVAAFYQTYRVHSFQVEVEAMARQASPKTTILQTFAATSNPAYGTGAVDLGPGCMELSRVDSVPSIAHAPNVVRFKTPHWRMIDVVPDLQSKADADYCGTIDNAGAFTSPTNSVNYVWLMNQDSAAAYTASECPILRMRLHQVVELFDVRPA
jgi:hypothetical protein